MSKNMLLAGCLSLMIGCGNSVSRLESDVARIERSLGDLRAIQAEQTTDLASVKGQLRTITGRIEEIEYNQRRSKIAVMPEAGAVSASPIPDIVPRDLLELDERYAREIPGEVGGALSKALSLVRAGDFTESINVLEHTIAVTPEQPWAPQVLFWIALSYEGVGDYKKALGAYHELSSTFPKHDRASAALWREGVVFLRLGDKGSAKLIFKKLVAQYSHTKEASLAVKRLRSM